MSLKYGNVELEGPFALLDELKDCAGVYALLCSDPETGHLELLQVRTARLVQTEVEKSLRDDWSELCKGKLRVAVFYGTDAQQLDQVKQQILSVL